MKRGMTLWRYFTDSQEHAGGFIMVKAVVGANWGDEGKGKITDMLAEKADIIIRFQGGANAGHTIINDYGKFALHTLTVRSFLRTYNQYHRQWCGAEISRFFSRKSSQSLTEMFRCRRFWCQTVHRW